MPTHLRDPDFFTPSREELNRLQNESALREAGTGRNPITAFGRGMRSQQARDEAARLADTRLEAELANDEATQRSALRRQREAEELARTLSPKERELLPILAEAGDEGAIETLARLGEYVGGTAGSAVETSIKPLVGGVAAGLAAPFVIPSSVVGTTGAAALAGGARLAGAAIPSFSQLRKENVVRQYEDPEIMERSPEERSRAATLTAIPQAGLEAVVPGRLSGTALRTGKRSSLRRGARELGESGALEAGTEVGQGLISLAGDKDLGSEREFSAREAFEEGAAGFVGGTALAGGARAAQRGLEEARDRVVRPGLEKLEERRVRKQAEAEAEAREGETATPSGAALQTDPETGEQFQDLADVTPDTEPESTSLKDRLKRAVSAENITEAVRNVFPDDPVATVRNAAESLRARLRGMDPADPAAEQVADQFEETQAQAAQRAAEELQADPATPETTKRQVEDLAALGDVESVLDVYEQEQTAKRDVQEVEDLTKVAEEVAAEERKSKGTKLSATSTPESGLIDLVVTNLTARARANPRIVRQIPAIAKALAQLAQTPGSSSAATAERIARVAGGTRIFKDPRKVLRDVPGVLGIEPQEGQTETSTLADRIANRRSATQEVADEDSFFRGALEPGVADQLSGPQLESLARLVDGFEALPDGEAARDAIGLLAKAFGGEEGARQVVEFYAGEGSTSRAAALDAEQEQTPTDEALEGEDAVEGEEGVAEGATRVIAGEERANRFAGFEEEDVKDFVPVFRDMSPARPFMKGREEDTQQLREILGEDPEAKADTYARYAELSGEQPGFLVALIRDDLKKRLKDAYRDDHATNTLFVETMDGIFDSRADMSDAERAAYDQALKIIRKPPEQQRDRSDAIARHEEELAMLNDESLSAEEKLDNYLVVLRNPKDMEAASDQDMTRWQRGKDRKGAEKTRITFRRQGARKGKLTLSAQAMTFNNREEFESQEEMSAAFLSALAKVLARPDIAGVVGDKGTLIPHDLELTPGHNFWDVWEQDRAGRGAFGGDTVALSPLEKRAQREKDAVRKAVTDPVIAELEKLNSFPQGPDFGPDQRALSGPQQDEAQAAYLREKARVIAERQNYLASELQDVEEQLAQPRLSKAQRSKLYRRRFGLMSQLGSYSNRLEQVQAEFENLPLPDIRTDAADVVATRRLQERTQEAGTFEDPIESREVLSDRLRKRGEDPTQRVAEIEKSRPEPRRTSSAQERATRARSPFKSRRELEAEEMPPKTADKGAKQSQRRPKRGRPKQIDKATVDKIRASIKRMRGADVKVNIGQALAGAMGGTGRFNMSDSGQDRVIDIAINAANPVGVGYHESLHDFFATLGGEGRKTPADERRLKDSLLKAVRAPHVKNRLRVLLENEPEALKAAEADPEEALAYAFEFWMQGALKMGPKGNSVFSKLAEAIKRILGIVAQNEQMFEVFKQLDSGALANPNTAFQVLQDKNLLTMNQKLNRLFPGFMRGANIAANSGAEQLTRFKIPAVNEIRDAFYQESGTERGDLPFLPRVRRAQGQWFERLGKILEGTTKAEQREAVDNLQAMKKPKSQLEKDLRKFFDDFHEYMRKADVKQLKNKEWVRLSKLPNYFPRRFDVAKIENNRTAFEDLVAKYTSPEEGRRVAEALIHGSGQIEFNETEHSLGFTPFAEGVESRRLTFINEQNAAEFAKFQEKDLGEIMVTYIQQGAHRAEYARSFENDGEWIQRKLDEAEKQGLTKKERADAQRVIRGLEGTLQNDMSPLMRNAMAAVLTVENVVLLPMAIFSQIVDPLNLAVRTGNLSDAGTAYARALRDLASTAKNLATGKGFRAGKDWNRELTEMLGVIDEQSMLEAMGQVYGGMYMSKTLRKINSTYFNAIGLQGWNNSMRVAAVVAGERYIRDNLKNKEAMEELGLKPGDVVFEKGRIVTQPGASPKLSKASAERVQKALFKFVDSAIIRPNAAHRPTWMSDPRFLLIGHLKQFAFSFHSVILKRVDVERQKGNHLPALLLATYLPVIMASDMAKWTLTGSVPDNWAFQDYFLHALARSGVLGKWQFADDMLGDAAHGELPGSSLLGPTVEHASTLAWWAAGDPRTDFEAVVDRSVPFARYFD